MKRVLNNVQVQKLGFQIFGPIGIAKERERGRREGGERGRRGGRGVSGDYLFLGGVCIRGWITSHIAKFYNGTLTFFKGCTADFISKNLTTPLVWKWPPTRMFVTSKSTFRITVKMIYSQTTNLYFSTYAPCFLL